MTSLTVKLGAQQRSPPLLVLFVPPTGLLTRWGGRCDVREQDMGLWACSEGAGLGWEDEAGGSQLQRSWGLPKNFSEEGSALNCAFGLVMFEMVPCAGWKITDVVIQR